MTLSEKAVRAAELLAQYYPGETVCYLDHGSPHELLAATILSAQCTDARVNIITPVLFARYKCPADFAGADVTELENYIRSAGFYHSKAKNIMAAMALICQNHGGAVPSDLESLTALPGVGRKTANVIRGHVYGIPCIVVDTHVGRVSGRLGLTESADPVKIEFDLMKILPESHWINFNTRVIAHGRGICRSQSPKCAGCFLADLCVWNNAPEK